MKQGARFYASIHRYVKRIWLIGSLVLMQVLGLCVCSMCVYAADDLDHEKQLEEQYLDKLDDPDMDRTLERLFPDQRIRFRDLVSQVISGDFKISGQMFKEIFFQQVLYAVTNAKQDVVPLVLLIFCSAVVMSFVGVFENDQISQICFYFFYLLIISICLETMRQSIAWVQDGVEGLTDFMAVFSTIYFPALAISRGSVSATAFYSLVLFLIYLIHLFLLKIVFPAVQMLYLIQLLNDLSEKSYFTKFAELMETIVTWILKSIFAVAVGLNFVQGLISPAIDQVKRSVVTRGAEAVPIIGDVVGGTAEVVLATASLVKNGIGITGAVFVCGICLVPIAEVGCIALLYKVMAAFAEPIADQRIIRCLDHVSQGMQLLMKITFTIGFLFLLTIVIVAASAGKL